MDEDSEGWPALWRDVDRTTLARLLSSGLTPCAVGKRYGRSTDTVRQRARTWGLDCRALRARSIGLAAQHPDVAAEFVKVVDGAASHFGPEDLLAGSGARCLWRCADCAEEWVTSVANRTKRRSGCPACAARRAIDRARARAAKSAPLAHVSEQLAREFVRNLSRPDRDADNTPSGAHDRILWRCDRGHEWETSARQRVRHRTQCSPCRSGLWSSRLEYEVAELVQLATGLEVRVGIRVHRTDRAATEHIDLLIEQADLWCDIDPSRWHSDERACARDLRKLERFAGQRYARIRPPGLGLLPADRARPEQQALLAGAQEDDPWLWAEALIRTLCAMGVTSEVVVPGPDDRSSALARADVRWRRATVRERSLASEFPAVAMQLVEVVGRPGLTAADLAPSGNDRAVWRCPDCLHEWEARVANRTVLGTGCPPCSYRRGAAISATPDPGLSFADMHPELVQFFELNETRPAKTLSDLKPNSIDRCRWSCPHCLRPWTATPRTLHRNPDAGCRVCGFGRSARARRGLPHRPELGDSFADRNPHLVQQFVENVTHPGVSPEHLRPHSRAVCIWRCRHCGQQWEAPVHARTRYPDGGCRDCSARRRRAARASTPALPTDQPPARRRS